MPTMFNARDWYWSVAGDAANVYSSARNIYVPVSDSDFTTWQASNGMGTTVQPIGSEAEIWHYVKDVMPLYLWNGTTMSQPAVDQYTKDQLQNYNAQVRWEKVSGGMTAAGIPVKTDDISRGYIDSGRAAATANPDFTTKWYGSDGQYYDVNSATMIAMSDAVAAHTNNCYLVFAQVGNDITLNTITTLAQIDTAYQGL